MSKTKCQQVMEHSLFPSEFQLSNENIIFEQKIPTDM